MLLTRKSEAPVQAVNPIARAAAALGAKTVDRRSFLKGSGLAAGAAAFASQLPLNMIGLPVIHSLFPDARIIFAQRHPCDCVLSGFLQSFTLNDAMACFLTIEGSAEHAA